MRRCLKVSFGHFDQFPPPSPIVGCRLGQGTFAEAIRQLPRRAESGHPLDENRVDCERLLMHKTGNIGLDVPSRGSMIGILGHVWGVSRAQDRIWGQVSGIAPSRAGRRLFMVLQAFVDESRGERGTFVLAG